MAQLRSSHPSPLRNIVTGQTSLVSQRMPVDRSRDLASCLYRCLYVCNTAVGLANAWGATDTCVMPRCTLKRPAKTVEQVASGGAVSMTAARVDE